MPARRPFSRLLPLVHDVTMAALAALLSVILRVGVDYAADPVQFLGAIAGLFAITALPVFLLTGSYRASWRFVSTREAVTLARAALIANVVFLPVLFFATRLEALPRSFIVINQLVLTALLVGPRLGVRLVREGRLAFDPLGKRPGKPVLVLGSDVEVDLFLRALEGLPETQLRAVGIIGSRYGQSLRGVPVLGPLDDLDDVLALLENRDDRPAQIIVADDQMEAARLKALVDQAAGLGLNVARVPRVTDLSSGAGSSLALRPIAIEDLLGRPLNQLNLTPVAELVRGRRILVTGAGGSIGSELVRQAARLDPAALSLIDANELALYQIDRELGENHKKLPRQALLIDVRHRARLFQAFEQAKPDLVFHAAALKHVPLVEANPIEGAETNILGTMNVADAANHCGALAMVLISTDKAVNPTNVMGATKRVAETYAQALDLAAAPGATRYVTVRFGNVLGSTGSVVPLFRSQLARGGPITVTHPDMKRFFMTIGEAVSLVLQASASAVSSQTGAGRIHVLDMGEQMRILDLAYEMIRLAGLEPGRDIAISFTGLRPGEKLEEELFHDGEPPQPTDIAGIMWAIPRAHDLDHVRAILSEIAESVARVDAQAVKGTMMKLVPEWRQETGPA
jgi:O-antigen biosynthesis protein WbqV